MISAAEGDGRGSSSLRSRTRSRFRRTALRVPPDILCDKNQQSEQVVRWNQRQEGHDEDGKDYNAKAMIQRNMEQIGQHNGYTGMENKKTSRRWDKTSSRNSKTRRLWTSTTVLRLQGSKQRDVLVRHR